jgi:hypothetical protein
MPTDSPAVVAGAQLGTGIVGGATGWELRYGKLPDSPNQIVLFTDSGGQSPNPRWRIDYPTFQARVRGEVDDYPGAYTKVRAVRDALLGLDSQTIGSDRWVSVGCLGDIAFLGYDDARRPEFTINFRAIIEPGTGANRDPL